jgi:hypothetical protein
MPFDGRQRQTFFLVGAVPLDQLRSLRSIMDAGVLSAATRGAGADVRAPLQPATIASTTLTITSLCARMTSPPPDHEGRRTRVHRSPEPRGCRAQVEIRRAPARQCGNP